VRNNYDNPTVLVTGYAPAPKGTGMYELYKYAGVVLEIDLVTDIILKAELTFITNLAKDFLSRLVEGYNLNDGIDNLAEIIRGRYWAPSTEAVIICFKSAIKRYFDMKRKYKNLT
jgi:hypothetical protein